MSKVVFISCADIDARQHFPNMLSTYLQDELKGNYERYPKIKLGNKNFLSSKCIQMNTKVL